MFNPQYKISNKLILYIGQVTELKTIIERSSIVPKQELIMKRKAMVRMAASSTAIEGNILNENEVEKVFDGKPTFAPSKFEIEVRNYKNAISFINEIFERKVKISLELILKVHSIIMQDLMEPKKIGKFRAGNVYIVNASELKDDLLYTAPPSGKVVKHMKALIHWIEESKREGVHPLIISSLFHYEFESIHPFTDGNGRVGRLMTTLLMYQLGYELNKIYTLDSYYNHNRMRYYKMLDIGKHYADRVDKDLTIWIEYFAEGVVWELSRIKEQIITLESQLHTKSNEPLFLDQDEVRILDFLATVGKITSKDVADITKVGQRGAQLKLKKLLEGGLISKRGNGPSSFYILVKK